ncbi:carbohydrate ABC transporter permease [Streptococcus halichoeri]|uniref:carbohydrate ABC transporter permease n=1 Tax=Streptococcus halichoeri TaxID=254785 RepID=UPI00135AD336|nr:carbohydrate ABC transporter permease [Streptococcus halichoeri]
MKTKSKFVYHLFMLGICLVVLYPISFIVANAFKPLKVAYHTVLSLIPNPFTLENFQKLFDSLPLISITWNTFFIATAITLLKLVLAFFAAYAFVYFKVKGQRLLYILMISTLFIPFTVTMIPNYLMISKLGLLDTSWGVILPQIADAMGIFLLTQTMRGIPRSLIEAAHLDHISQKKIMLGIVFPLIKHSLTSTGIWFFITSWNEFVWPVLILKSVKQFTLPLAMQMYISSEGGTNFTMAMAISLMSMLVPLLLYICFQKYIISTFISSGIK